MSTQKLEIVIGAEVKGVVKGVQETTKALNTLPPAAAKAGAALNTLNKGTANATTTLFNFGRVVQDAPFGLIGIANNIDPLISSFQSLKATTGTTGAAFKALLGSLAGPAGIGIAISAVTSALIAFGPQLFGASKEAKALDEALDGMAKTTAEDLVKLQSYALFAQDASKATDERKKAVDALQKEYPQYLKNISDEALLTGKATEALNKSVDAILRKATLDLLKDEIAAIVAESAKQILAVEKGIIAAKQAQAAQERLKKGLDGTNDEFEKQAQAALASGRAMGDITREYSSLNNAAEVFAENTPEKRIARIKDELQALVGPLVAASVNFEDLGGKTEKAAKGAKDIADKIGELRKLIGETDLSGAGGVFTIRAEIDKENTEKAFKDLKETVKQNLAFQDGAIVIPAKFKFDGVPLAPIIKEQIDAAIKEAKRLQDFADGFNQIITRIGADAVSGIAEGIGNALSGVKNPFAPLLTVLGEGLISLGKYVIQTSVTLEVLKKTLDKLAANPVLGIAIGAAMVALGSVIKSKVNSTKFAEGGIVSGPLNAQIGEAGQSEVIMPLSRLSSILGGGSNSGRVVFEISGQKLIGVLNRGIASQNRTFG